MAGCFVRKEDVLPGEGFEEAEMLQCLVHLPWYRSRPARPKLCGTACRGLVFVVRHWLL